MTNEDIVEIATMLQSRASLAMKALESVKSELGDGSPDWKAFHKARMNHANLEATKAYGLLDRFTKEHRNTIRKAFGLDG